MIRKWMSRCMAVIVAGVMMVSMTGCGGSVGNGGGSDDFDDLFPDRVAAESGGSYKHTDLGYKFSLDGYGEMLVYVDTTDKHSFELKSENGGFNINDESGQTVVYAAALNADAYRELTASLTDVETINGRQFFISENGDGSTDAFSYMADCGLDCGFVMEVKGDTSAFSLVAYRGTAIPGSSSDPYAYKGESAAEPEEIEPETDEISTDDTDEGDAPSVIGGLTNNSLSDEVQSTLESLESDFGKVYWGSIYSIDGVPGVVISVTPITSYGKRDLIVGITNLYDMDISFSATATAYGDGDKEVGSSFMYEPAIGPGITAIQYISCEDGTPDGRIHWEDCEIEEAALYEGIIWEADWQGSGNPADGHVEVNCTISSGENKKIESGMITALLLSDDGFVVGYGNTYLLEEIPAGASSSETISIWNDEDSLSKATGVALFATPMSVKE